MNDKVKLLIVITVSLLLASCLKYTECRKSVLYAWLKFSKNGDTTNVYYNYHDWRYYDEDTYNLSDSINYFLGNGFKCDTMHLDYTVPCQRVYGTNARSVKNDYEAQGWKCDGMEHLLGDPPSSCTH